MSLRVLIRNFLVLFNLHFITQKWDYFRGRKSALVTPKSHKGKGVKTNYSKLLHSQKAAVIGSPSFECPFSYITYLGTLKCSFPWNESLFQLMQQAMATTSCCDNVSGETFSVADGINQKQYHLYSGLGKKLNKLCRIESIINSLDGYWLPVIKYNARL